MNISTSNLGLTGLSNASQEINRASSEIVKHNFLEQPLSSLADELMALKENVLIFEASGKVVKASDDNIGTLLDISV